MKRKKKKILIISLSVLGAILVLPAGFLGIVAGMAETRAINLSSNASKLRSVRSGLVYADGNSLYDANGNRLVLQGVNAGNLLIYEGWISPFSVGECRDYNG